MSEKWETVGKAKSSASAANKTKMNGAKNGKASEAKVYTMEEVLPASSVQNMYGAFNPPPVSPKKDKKESK